jgi:hypothetical protein
MVLPVRERGRFLIDLIILHLLSSVCWCCVYHSQDTSRHRASLHRMEYSWPENLWFPFCASNDCAHLHLQGCGTCENDGLACSSIRMVAHVILLLHRAWTSNCISLKPRRATNVFRNRSFLFMYQDLSCNVMWGRQSCVTGCEVIPNDVLKHMKKIEFIDIVCTPIGNVGLSFLAEVRGLSPAHLYMLFFVGSLLQKYCPG